MVFVLFSNGLTKASGGDAYLGLYTLALNESLHKKADYSENGLYVEKVEYDSPAYSAGIKAGDVVISVDKKRITNKKSLKRVLWKLDPGDKVTVVVWRKGKKLDLVVELGMRPDRVRYASRYPHKSYCRSEIFDFTDELPDIEIGDIVVPNIEDFRPIIESEKLLTDIFDEDDLSIRCGELYELKELIRDNIHHDLSRIRCEVSELPEPHELPGRWHYSSCRELK